MSRFESIWVDLNRFEPIWADLSRSEPIQAYCDEFRNCSHQRHHRQKATVKTSQNKICEVKKCRWEYVNTFKWGMTSFLNVPSESSDFQPTSASLFPQFERYQEPESYRSLERNLFGVCKRAGQICQKLKITKIFPLWIWSHGFQKIQKFEMIGSNFNIFHKIPLCNIRSWPQKIAVILKPFILAVIHNLA